jgi:hypothetical protein
MGANEPFFSRRAVWFCCIFGFVHLLFTIVVFVVSLGFAVRRHVTGDPPNLVAEVTHAISSALLSPAAEAFVAIPSLDALLPGGLSYVLLLLNSALWAVSAWAVVWLLRRSATKMRLHAP